MSYWLDELDPRFESDLELRDPGGINRALYRKVWVQLGGPHRPSAYKRALPDEYTTLSFCLGFPFQEWVGWFLVEDDDDDLRWWPQLAWLAASHVGQVRSAQNFPDISFGELKTSVRRLSSALRAAEDELQLLFNTQLVHRPQRPNDINKENLIHEISERFALEWGRVTGAYHRLGGPLNDIRRLSNIAREEATRLDDLDAHQFKAGGERAAGLNNLVIDAGLIWIDRYETVPSAEKVERKDNVTDPPFVRFVQDICCMTRTYQPTRLQVAGAIRNAKTQGYW